MSVTHRTVVQGSRVHGYAIMSGSRKAKYTTKKNIITGNKQKGAVLRNSLALICLRKVLGEAL